MEVTAAAIASGEAVAMMADMKKKKKLKRVMVALDESDVSLYALKWALDVFLPSMAEEAKLTIVHVQPPFESYIYTVGPVIYAKPPEIELMRKAQQEGAEKLFAQALPLCSANKVNADTLVLEGDAKDMICEATEKMEVDLLVMGSRGLGMIKRTLLGSISDYCVHHAKCPVLIVRTPKEMTTTHK
ncbi:universal stress protein A-like protein [Impatiens glandulifera]|uniref:universal stress protein A-like protein n=1 Tax=Impatiens glandulifera TaxID=253017 RepID=UPI001FB12371|nr:universal stress protein A-like protein [Impatiens glandulifera]